MNFILFADDTSIVASVKCHTELITLKNEALRKIKLWLEKTRFTLNKNEKNLSFFIANKLAILL